MLGALFIGEWANEEFIPFDDLLPRVNAGLPHSDLFGTGEARAIMEQMAAENEIMFSNEWVGLSVLDHEQF